MWPWLVQPLPFCLSPWIGSMQVTPEIAWLPFEVTVTYNVLLQP